MQPSWRNNEAEYEGNNHDERPTWGIHFYHMSQVVGQHSCLQHGLNINLL